MFSPSRYRELARLLPVGALCLLSPLALQATNYTILTTADGAVNNGNCTLREAIRAANTNAAVDACPAGTATDFIFLPNGTYPFAAEEYVAAGGAISILGQTLNPFAVAIDLGGSERFLTLQNGGSYTLGGLTITNGNVSGSANPGGAIAAFGVALRMYSFRFVLNHSDSSAGAIVYAGSQPAHTFTVDHGTFQSNSVGGPPSGPSEGGAMSVDVTGGASASLSDVAFIGNSVIETETTAQGGALSVDAVSSSSRFRCVRCVFDDNAVTAQGPSADSYADGGAIRASAFLGARIEIVDSSFTGNAALNASVIARAVSVLYGNSQSGGSLELERLFIDFNDGVENARTFDVALRSDDDSSTLSFLNSQLSFGIANGISVDAAGDAILGHLTIVDYPLVGADLATIGSPLPTSEVLLQNSILALSGTDLVASGAVVGTTNFIGGDPLFVNVGTGDYHLNDLSSAIDAGTNGAASVRIADRDHHGRIAGGTTDIGCYERDGLYADDFEVGDVGGWALAAP